MDINRLENRLKELGQIGKSNLGGTTRHSYTQQDLQACKLLERWMLEADLEVSYDAVGNLIGKKVGTNPKLKPLAIGSHFDSVKEGGIYDGCLGVVGAIEVAEALKKQTFARTLLVIGFRDEEGYFSKGMVGSKAAAGVLEADDLNDTNELNEVLINKIQAYGYHPENYKQCKLDLEAYLECHIEQGSVLDKLNIPVGIVLGIVELQTYKVIFKGESGHAGTTPMTLRRDPVLLMSRWILKLEQKVAQYKDMVFTVGKIKTLPGSVNVICSEVEISLDIRSPYKKDIAKVITELTCDENVEIIPCVKLPGVMCDGKLIAMFNVNAQKLKIDVQELFSGAGHDAMNFKDKCPVGMIFVRSINGISHHQDEYSTPIDCQKALLLLLETTKQLLCV